MCYRITRGWKNGEREKEKKCRDHRHKGRQDRYISPVEVQRAEIERKRERKGWRERVPVSGKPDRNKRGSCEMGCRNKVKF